MNRKWWIIGSLIVVGAGVGAYFLFRPSKEEREEKKLAKGNDKDDKTNSNSLGETTPKDAVNEKQVSTNAYNSRPRETYPETPFKNETEGNVFRKWVNDKYPDYAKSIDLDPSGSHNNAYIRKAWQKYGTEFEKEATEKAKKESGIKTIEITKTFQESQRLWKKATSLNKNGIAYFILNFKAIYTSNSGTSLTDFFGCKGKIYVYNNFAGKKPLDNRVVWQLWYDGVQYAQGSANARLNNIYVSWRKKGGNLPTFTNVDSVGRTFGQLMDWDGVSKTMKFSWC